MAIKYLKKANKTPSTDDHKTRETVQNILNDIEKRREEGIKEITKKFDNYDGEIIVSKEKILSRPHVQIQDIKKTDFFTSFFKTNGINNEALEQLEIDIKYKGYIEKEKTNADKLTRLENIKLPENFKYNILSSISSEGRQKLLEKKPRTIGQASRISGVSPSDVNVLLVHLGR